MCAIRSFEEVSKLGLGRFDTDCFIDIVAALTEGIQVIYGRDRKLSLSLDQREKVMPARIEEIEHAEEEGVELELLTLPVGYHGSSGWLKEMECLRMELGEPDISGRRRPVPIEGSNFRIKLDTVVVAIGQSPNPLVPSTTPGLDVGKHGNIIVESETEQVQGVRKSLIEMLFVEGNHYCMFCEKSGNCELQAMAYRFGIAAPTFPYQYPERELDATHPQIFIDRNRCILCARCVRASKDLDGKNVFQFIDRGSNKKIAVNAWAKLVDTDLDITDKAVDICPVGAILKKGEGFKVPIGKRLYDSKPIGSEIESASK